VDEQFAARRLIEAIRKVNQGTRQFSPGIAKRPTQTRAQSRAGSGSSLGIGSASEMRARFFL
jgi:hypothetical protein